MDDPIWETLETPRDLDADERRLLVELASAVPEPALRRQLDTASVSAVCRCGCSSLRLVTGEEPIAVGRVARLGRDGRDDYFSVEAGSRASGGASVQVALHVVDGRVHELEVFAGEGVPVRLSDVADLTDVTVH